MKVFVGIKKTCLHTDDSISRQVSGAAGRLYAAQHLNYPEMIYTPAFSSPPPPLAAIYLALAVALSSRSWPSLPGPLLL